MFRVALLVSASIVLAGCGASTPAPQTDAPKSDSALAASEAAPPAASSAVGHGPPLGIASCDAYVAEADACYAKLVTDQAQSFQKQLQAQIDDWRSIASTEERRAALTDACEAARIALAAIAECK